ncbi:MAG: DUF4368 domain-containing protein [Oscillospiraceae bacterium]|nr:DUF4368 domain-containing protein [Oscillospiraceae bacterium]
MSKPPNNGKITALYERLSKDDEQKNESVSIAHQKQILEGYARKQGFQNICHFTDDGVTGTVFNRPGLNAMVEEVKAGNVATVIIKDQSRIGRDVLEVGLLKRTFEEYNVRFIAAEDGLDTANGFDIMSIFRDVINEFYVADTSRKIKAVFKSRMEKGLRCSGSIPYGYLPNGEDKEKLIIDSEAAVVVRRIFQSIIEGKSIADIGRELRAEQIPIPSEHWKRIGHPVRSVPYTDPYAWSASTIGNILKRPEYKGCKILGKTVSESYKRSKSRKTAPEEQYVFDGAIPVIVEEEIWNNAQRLRKTVRRPPKREGSPNPLTGLLYCADCNSKMTHRVSLVQKKYIDDAFICSSYRQLTRDCTMHYISTKNIETLILSTIQRISWYVRENETEFVQRVREAYAVQQEETVKDSKRKLTQVKKRFAELDTLVKKLYESNATGKLSDRHFARLMDEYDAEQNVLELTMRELQAGIDAWGEDKLKTDRFIELVKRYTDFSELTTPMLNEFVERVTVYEGEGRGASRRVRIDIHLNFIGRFEVPAEIVTPMELEEKRRFQGEQDTKAKDAQERYEQRKAAAREFTARMKAGLLTPEELEEYNRKRERNRAWQKEWRNKRKAAEPPKPPKPLSQNEIVKRHYAGLPLTDEEYAIYRAWQDKKTEQARERRRGYNKEQHEKRKAALPMAANQ